MKRLVIIKRDSNSILFDDENVSEILTDLNFNINIKLLNIWLRITIPQTGSPGEILCILVVS